jgi:putative transposase
VRAIESRLDLPELKQFRSIIAELDADMRRDSAKEVAEKVQRILAGG